MFLFREDGIVILLSKWSTNQLHFKHRRCYTNTFISSVADPKQKFRIWLRIRNQPAVSFWSRSGFKSRIRIQIRIRNVYLSSGSDRIKVPDPSGSATLYRVWFVIWWKVSCGDFVFKYYLCELRISMTQNRQVERGQPLPASVVRRST